MGAPRVGIAPASAASAYICCVLLALAGLPSSAAVIKQFNETGPYGTNSYSKTVKFVLPSHTRVEVPVVVTYPTSQSDDESPFPLVIAFNGYLVSKRGNFDIALCMFNHD